MNAGNETAERSGPRKPGTLTADVCIVGSGPAGLALAKALSRAGWSTLIVERGGRQARLNSTDTSVFHKTKVYEGATLGRGIGFGGTSAFWGGQLLPIKPEEMRRANGSALTAWPVDFSELAGDYRFVEECVGVDALPFDATFLRAVRHPAASLRWGKLAPRFTKWIPFQSRNLGASWRDLLEQPCRTKVLLNTRVKDCSSESSREGERIVGVTLSDERGTQTTVTAKHVVIAAGALESTCLLEQIVRGANDTRAAPPHLGRYLHDHLSIRVARVTVRDRRRFNRLFAPYFNGATMHSMRIEVAPEHHDLDRIAAGYCHFVAESGEHSGFALVRDVLRALQSRDWRKLLESLIRLPLATAGIAEIVAWRYLRKRLPFTRGSSVYLHFDIEQPPNGLNTVQAADSLGAHSMAIDWDLRFDPRESLAFYRQAIDEFWASSGLREVADLDFIDVNTTGDFTTNMYAIYHPAGTTRMADSAANGVVDHNLRVFGFDNLYVLSSSVFPSMGAANPTFTLMALASRLARHFTATVEFRSS